jgi:large subunit ribosomal protein L23
MAELQLHDILLRPLVTEKSVGMEEAENTYTFQVGDSANKHQIQQAVESFFGVKVLDVRTSRVRGKVKRFGRHHGKRSNWKKAYVKLADGDSIDLFEKSEG